MALEIPTEADGIGALADHVEVSASAADDGSVSRADLVAQIKRFRYAPGDDHGDEDSQRVADEVFDECSGRASRCGSEKYGFAVDKNVVQSVDEDDRLPYLFQLLLSRFGLKAGPPGTYGERLFEDLSVQAAGGYFGPELHETLRFAHPRVDHSNFHSALTTLCSTHLREGKPRGSTTIGMKDQKDGGVDVIAWRPFPDLRSSQMVAFGQCATGEEALELQKVGSLDLQYFTEMWLEEPIACTPVRMYFLPQTVATDRWTAFARKIRGVLFDRCRIASCVADLPVALKSKLRKWVKFVVAKKARD